ncbi:MAG: serine protease [Planctomycetes bacterium]|nr:serine protease [Planctomycetota bacterium]
MARCRGVRPVVGAKEMVASALAVVLALGVAGPARAQGAGLEQVEAEMVRVAEKARASVVRITYTLPGTGHGRGAQGGDGGEGQRPPWEEAGRQARVNASGVILTRDGAIVTVGVGIQGAEEITVELADGTVLPATAHAVDAATGLAVVRAAAVGVDLTPATFGDSDALRVGNFLVVVGNPYGFSHSLSVGHVSGLKRPVTTGGTLAYNAIQTSAQINPGDSGAFVGDSQGRMVGIVASTFGRGGAEQMSAALEQTFDKLRAARRFRPENIPHMFEDLVKNIFRRVAEQKEGEGGGPLKGALEGVDEEALREAFERDYQKLWEETMKEMAEEQRRQRSAAVSEYLAAQGINFVMPGNVVKRVAFDLIRRREVRRGALGLSVDVSRRALGKTSTRPQFRVAEVEAGGAAEAAGVRPEDEILRLDGKRLLSIADVHERLLFSEPGETVELQLLRGEETVKARVAITHRKPAAAADKEAKSGN